MQYLISNFCFFRSFAFSRLASCLFPRPKCKVFSIYDQPGGLLIPLVSPLGII